MSELDVAKEKIAYLKVWLGILVVTDISTFGWLISNVDTATTASTVGRSYRRHCFYYRDISASSAH